MSKRQWNIGCLGSAERDATGKARTRVATFIASGLFLALAFGLAGSAAAQMGLAGSTAAQLETYFGNNSSGTLGLGTSGSVLYNGTGGTGEVITSILNSHVNSNNTTSWAFFANDGTGSIEVFNASFANSGTAAYTPTVGDIVSVQGKYSPFQQVPELASVGNIPFVTLLHSGSSQLVPIPTVYNISQVSTAPVLGISGGTGSYTNAAYAGQLVELDNVSISGLTGSFGAANLSGGIYDASYPSGVTFYYWPSSNSICYTNLGGKPIPTGEVNTTGYVHVFGANQVEFTPITISPALGIGAVWAPQSNNNWDGISGNFSASGSAIAVTTNCNATFDDSGLSGFGGVVSLSGTAQAAQSITVSNSAGTYTFSGTGGITTSQLTKNGNGTLLVNTTLTSALNNITAGTLGGTGTIVGNVTVGGSSGAVLTPGSPSSVGMMTLAGNVDFSSSSGTYLWKYGSNSNADSNSGGTAGATWDLLNLSKSGNLNFGSGAQLSLSFSGAANPNDGTNFWNSCHTWVIATSGASAPTVGGSILSNSFSAGTFSLQGDTSNDLVLKFTTSAASGQARNLFWADGVSTSLVDTSGTWDNTNWTDGTTPGLSFDSVRADNATFGNPGGSSGTASVSVSGVVNANRITFSGSNAAQYTLTGGSIVVNNGITANQSATIASKVFLGSSQNWNVASGTLTASGGISQATVSSLTTTGTGMLVIGSAASYTGGTNLSQGAISVTGASFLPSAGSVSLATGTLLAFNSKSETIGALTGAAGSTVSMGTAGTFTFGDATSQIFSGIISGTGSIHINGNPNGNGSGSETLLGANTFKASITVGYSTPCELFVNSDQALGNPANTVQLELGAALGVLSNGFSTNRSIILGYSGAPPFFGELDVVGSNTTATFSGVINGASNGGSLTVNNPSPPAPSSPLGGVLVLTNTGNTQAGTVIGGGTLSVSSSGALGLANTAGGLPPVVFQSLGLLPGGGANYRPSTLQFTNAGPITVGNAFTFPASGSGNPYVDTEGGIVTLTGGFVAQPGSNNDTIGLKKTGPGTLVIAGTSYNANTITNFAAKTYIHEVQQGTLVVAALMSGAQYSELGNGNIEVHTGATFQLANVQIGIKSDAAGTTGNYMDLDDGATLSGTGNSCLMNTDVTPVISSSAANVTISTANPSDVLSLLNTVKQLGSADAVLSGSTWVSASNAATIHVSGPGTVQLQPGGLYTNNGSVRDFATGINTAQSSPTFGGNWSVEQGTLELGPFYTSGDPRVTQPYYGPYAQMLNGLGFKTVNGQADPDIPNGVTVNSGGSFVVAVDQVNTLYDQINPITGTSVLINASSAQAYGANGTPNYLRNPITLNGGELAVSGSEVAFGVSTDGVNYCNPLVTSSTTLVTARLGGDFSVTGTNASTIATYDSTGAARTVQLLGGTRVLSNSTAAYSAGTALNYYTSWGGTLNVDGGGHGGEFQLLRDSGGSATYVAPGAAINILNQATVRVGDLDAAAEASAGTEVAADPYGALSDGTNSVNFTGTGAPGQGGHLVFSRNANMTYAGDITGNLDLTKQDSGVLLLSGTNQYSGGTAVSGGELKVLSPTALPNGGDLTVGNFPVPAPIVGSANGQGVQATAVPEPSSIALLVAVLVGGSCVYRRRFKFRRANSTTKFEL